MKPLLQLKFLPFSSLVILIAIMGCPFAPRAQQKIINKQSQAWVSLNSTVKVKGKWGFIADIHERRANFFKNNDFHFVRAAVDYWLKDNITIAGGYAHLWLAPTTKGWSTIANENRLYQQAQIISKVGRINMMQRLRNEQRWQQKIAGDHRTGKNKFTDRVRYLLSFTVPVAKSPSIPSLVISDEMCVQFGKEIVYNTFDQNRLFFGIKQRITKSFSFDLGYMQIKQQKSSGIQYDKANLFRLFFYYNADWRKSKAKA